jgi:ribonuclease P protein component
VQHLLHKSQFDAVLGTRSHLSKVARTEHFFVHRLQLDWDNPTIVSAFAGRGHDVIADPKNTVFVGVMSPKRFAKRAVTRNLIKRQIYALTTESPLSTAAYVVRLKAPFAKDQFKSASSDALKRLVRAELQQIFRTFLAAPAVAA